MLNATLHSQTMADTELLAGLVGVICKVRLEGIVVKRRTLREMLHMFVIVTQRLQERWLYAAAHKCYSSRVP